MRIKSTRNYLGLERGLSEANKNHLISCSKQQMHETKTLVEQLIQKIVTAMLKQSPTFSKLYTQIFGVGSAYEETKIGKPNEFDIDIVLKIPEMVKPVLKDGEVPGFTQLQLENFEILKKVDPEMHRTLNEFLDNDNYLLSEEMMNLFIKKILTKALSSFPDGALKVGDMYYKVSKIIYIEPALTLTIEGSDFLVSVDLVASILFNNEFLPGNNYFQTYPHQGNFFLAPARPVQDCPHKPRFWRYSFHLQERQIIFNCYRMKPALRVLKRIRDHFNQPVHSYALKNLFLSEILNSDSYLLWQSSLSYIVIYMMEKYHYYLAKRNIPYFWNTGLNLLSYLTQDEIEKCRRDVAAALADIKKNPEPEVILKYLK